MEQILKKRKNKSRLNSGTAIHGKGKERVKEILALSRQILIDEGYVNFTLRNISTKLDISMGNLNYYFASKNDIIHTLIEEIINNYERDYAESMSQVSNDPRERFLAHINYLITDLKKPSTRGFFFQLYGMSTHDMYVDSCREEFYSYGIKTVKGLILELNPELTSKIASHRAALIIALVDGMMIVIGARKEITPPIRGFETQFRLQALNIALSTEIE